ncbi:hypothetical protein ACHAPT_004298 [Fusarium lateritium]
MSALYLGCYDEFLTGLLFSEASHGSFQRFLDDPNQDISLSLRKKFCRQAVEAVAYIHSRGVIHSDLRLDNFLVHSTNSTDFGGSACEIGLSGCTFPDDGFFDPNSDWTSTPATDVFSLGSILYTIVAGHWPYRDPPCGFFTSSEEMDGYESRVNGFFKEGIFPDTKELYAGEIMLGCWTKQYSTVDEIAQGLHALEASMSESQTG